MYFVDLHIHVNVFVWQGGGGITRINGTNAVHLEAIDHGTVQPSYTNVSIFPRTTNWSSIIKGLYHKKWELRRTPFFTSLQSPSSFLVIISIVPSFAWTEPLSLLAIVCQNSPLHPLPPLVSRMKCCLKITCVGTCRGGQIISLLKIQRISFS